VKTNTRISGMLIALHFSALACMLWGQAMSSLRGNITDAQAAAIDGAVVKLESAETGWRRSVLTSNTGSYQFSQVPPGTYVLLVEKPGFAGLTQKGVQLLVNTPASLDLKMDVASMVQTVNVEAEVAKINSVDASLGTAFNETQVRQLPLLTRNVVELLSLQAGVTATGEVLGARRDQNNITLDGVDVNDNQTAGLEGGPNGGFNNASADRPGGFNAALPVPLDSVQEFRVTVGGQNANQGRSSGGQVSLITKGGSNQLHGSLYEFHRNTVTSANNWFNNRAGVKREPLIRNQFGASVGGRIVRDRAFYFLNWEQRRDASGYSQLRNVPSESFKNGEIRVVTNDGATRTLSAADVRAIDPLRLGASPTMLNLFKQMPVGNDPNSGLDRGLNFSVFRFNAPFKLDNKAYVGKMDFRLDEAGRHSLSLRGTLADNIQDDGSALAPYPGQPAAAQLLNNSRGLSGLYTQVLTPSLVNVVTAGLTRIGIERTGSTKTGFTIDTINLAENFTRGYIRTAPTYNFADDLTWTKGSHTVTGGVNLRVIRNDRTSFANAFENYSYGRGSLSGLGADIVTATEGFLANSTGNANIRLANSPALSRAFGNLTGLISGGSMTYSYDRAGNPLPIGTPPLRQFASNDLELYIADSWRVNPALTLTYGVRWTRFGVPYEQNGLQVAPTFSAQAYYAERYGGMLAGIPSFQLPNAIRQYDWNGPANGADSWYRPDNNNFAPRFAFAYSPRNTDGWLSKVFGSGGVFRGGAALVYDRFGSQLVTNFDQAASFGLTEIKNLGQSVNFTTGPRYDGTFPPIPAASVHQFPFTPPNVDFIGGNYMGIASDLRTPYSVLLNASYARELPGGITMEVGYAGRLSRKLLMQIDAGGWALLFKDPKSGIVWKDMAREMRNHWNAGIDPRAVASNPGLIPMNAFIENQMAGLTNFYFPGSASANYYNLLWGQNAGSDADAVHQVDRIRRPSLGNRCMSTSGCFTFYPPQSSGSSTWTNVGFANYHGGTLTIRRALAKGFAYDFNYTLSHSIDNGGAPESGGGTHAGIMLNPFDYGAFRGSSDFDMRHNLNANSLVELPFGKGRKFLTNATPLVNQLVGGWQVSGIFRYNSGLPSSVAYTGLWPTNFSFSTVAYPVGPYEAKVQINDIGNPSIFGNVREASNWKPMYPGEVGKRAAVRLDNLVNTDISIAKAIFLPWEGHRLQFRAEAFNAFNNVNFLNLSLDANSPSNFGQFTSAGAPRVMQFALRYEF
jgi:hypothetical protein